MVERSESRAARERNIHDSARERDREGKGRESFKYFQRPLNSKHVELLQNVNGIIMLFLLHSFFSLTFNSFFDSCPL